MFDGDESLLVGSAGLADRGGDSENSLLGQRGLDSVGIHTSWQREALAEALSAAAPTVRRLLLVLGLHDDGVVHGLDEELLRLVLVNIHNYLKYFVEEWSLRIRTEVRRHRSNFINCLFKSASHTY